MCSLCVFPIGYYIYIYIYIYDLLNLTSSACPPLTPYTLHTPHPIHTAHLTEWMSDSSQIDALNAVFPGRAMIATKQLLKGDKQAKVRYVYRCMWVCLCIYMC